MVGSPDQGKLRTDFQGSFFAVFCDVYFVLLLSSLVQRSRVEEQDEIVNKLLSTKF
jgi:hypothetical protein